MTRLDSGTTLKVTYNRLQSYLTTELCNSIHKALKRLLLAIVTLMILPCDTNLGITNIRMSTIKKHQQSLEIMFLGCFNEYKIFV